MKGVADASLATAIECVLSGDEPRISGRVGHRRPTIPPTSASTTRRDAVGMHEAPREALRAKRDASIRVGASLVAEGQADALVSAGNTGACLLACAREFRQHQGRAEAGARERVPAAHRASRARIGWRSCSTSARPCAATPWTSCSSRSWGASTRSASRRWRGRASRCSTWAPRRSRAATCCAEAHERLATLPARQLRRQHRGQRHRQGQGRRDHLRRACSAASSSSSSRASPTS